jgi:hypothetical protein
VFNGWRIHARRPRAAAHDHHVIEQAHRMGRFGFADLALERGPIVDAAMHGAQDRGLGRR